MRPYLDNENADDLSRNVRKGCLNFVMALSVPRRSFGKHKSAHPLDLLVGVLDREVVGLGVLLEQAARVRLVDVRDEGEGKRGLRVGEAGAEDGFLEGGTEFARGGDRVRVHGVLVDVDVLDGRGVGEVVVEHDETSAVEREVVVGPFVAEHLGRAALAHPAGVVEDVGGSVG